MGFTSRDLTVKLFASGCGCTNTPPDCEPSNAPCGCTNTPPDCEPSNAPCGCTNTPPDCTPTPGGGDRPKRALGLLRQQLRESLAQNP